MKSPVNPTPQLRWISRRMIPRNCITRVHGMSTEEISHTERLILLKAIFSGVAEVYVEPQSQMIQVQSTDLQGARSVGLWLDCCERQGLSIETNTVKMIAVWLLNRDEFHQLATQTIPDTTWLSLDITSRLVYRTPPRSTRQKCRVLTI